MMGLDSSLMFGNCTVAPDMPHPHCLPTRYCKIVWLGIRGLSFEVDDDVSFAMAATNAIDMIIALRIFPLLSAARLLLEYR